MLLIKQCALSYYLTMLYFHVWNLLFFLVYINYFWLGHEDLMQNIQSRMIFKCLFSICNITSFSSWKYFSMYGNNTVWEVKSLVAHLRIFCFHNNFFTISPLSTVNLDASLYSAGGFSKVSQLTNYLISLAKFSKSISLEAFLMLLHFLFSFKFFRTSRYYFGLTTIVTR